MKFLFVIQNMKVGGVQNSLLNLTSELINQNYLVDYFIIDNRGELIEKIDSRVKTFKISKKNQKIAQVYQKSFKEILKTKKINDILLKLFISSFKILGLKCFITRFITRNVNIDSEYDYVISFDGMPGIADEFVANFKGKKISWVHNDVNYFNFSDKYLLKNYERFDKISIVSKSCKNSFDKKMPLLKNRTYTVYNALNYKKILQDSCEFNPFNDECIKFVVVSRMQNSSKRIDRIIKAAFKLIENKTTNFKIYLVGDGPSLNYYKSMVENYGINEYIHFLGNKNNPYPYIRYADMLVISSEFEGYPMTLKEAYLLNTPCISTDFSVAFEVINNNFDGLIVERSTEGVFKGMKYILENEEKIKNFRINMKSKCISNEIVIDQFINMINE